MSEITYSVVVPTLNEQESIAQCIESLLSAAPSPKPDNLEILIIDGLSDDATRDIVTEYSSQTPCVRLINNHKQSTPTGLNIGFDEATNDVVVIMSGHAYVADDFFNVLDSCFASAKLNADVIGPRALPLGNGYLQTGIAGALVSRLGAASSRFEPIDEYVDTVPYGAYRREVIDEIGRMDTSLVRGQDYEYNQRVRNAGYNIYQTSGTNVYYYPRKTLKSLFKQKFGNGKARFQIHNRDSTSTLLSYISNYSPQLTLLIAGFTLLSPFILLVYVMFWIYITAIATASYRVITRENWLGFRHLPVILAALVTIHTGFVTGFLHSIAKS